MARADICIKFGAIAKSNPDEMLLAEECVAPVCSQRFARTHGLSTHFAREQLTDVPLLHMGTPDPRWPNWHEYARLASMSLPVPQPQIRYDNYPLLLDAAPQGLGVALGWSLLVGDLVRSQELTKLEPSVCRADHDYIIASRFFDNSVVAPVIGWFVDTVRDSLVTIK